MLITQLLADSSDREAAAFREFARTQVGKVHSMCAAEILARSKVILAMSVLYPGSGFQVQVLDFRIRHAIY